MYRQLEEQGLSYVDATCPFVLKIHRIVEQESQKGKQIIIVGDPSHPEVQGICGWCFSSCTVIRNKEEAQNLELKEGVSVCIVSQTTFNYNNFKDIVEILRKRVMIIMF